ncbi:11077_t:CDS:1, partial [Funneliformis mosseae]
QCLINPVFEWSYLSFFAMKPYFNSVQGSLDKRKSIWQKQFLTFLTGILVDEEEQKIYKDN